MAWTQKATKGKGDGDFERPPPGNHVARLIGMFDLGIQETEFQGVKKEQHRIQWVWELLNEKQSGTKGVNHVIGMELTLSLNEKAKMRKFIEARTGKSIPDGIEYDIVQELGQACLLNVVMNGDYPKVDGVSALPKGMDAPKAQREPVALTHTEIMAGSEIPDWAPFIYGEPPMDVAKRGTSPDEEESTAPKSTSPASPASPAASRPGPPPRRKEVEANYYLATSDDSDPVLVPMSRIKELVGEQGKAAFSWQVCPETGKEWKPLADAIPESANWAPF